MPDPEVREYLLRRESECREMAVRAKAPFVRKIHEYLAEQFAARAEEASGDAAYTPERRRAERHRSKR